MNIGELTTGDIWIIDCQIVPGENPEITDLTGYTIASQMKGRGSTYDFAATITDGPERRYQLVMQPAVTRDIVPGVYLWDVEFTINGNPSSTPVETLTVVPDVTNG